MAVKVSRYLTHVRRLRDPASRWAAWSSGPRAWATGWARTCPSSRPPCGPMRTAWTPASAFPARARVAVEPRHESWWSDEVRARPRAPVGRPVLGRPPQPPGHAPVGDGAWGYCPPPRGHGIAPPVLRPHRPVHVARPHHRGLARRPPRRLRLLQQRRGGAAVRNARTLRRLAANPAVALMPRVACRSAGRSWGCSL